MPVNPVGEALMKERYYLQGESSPAHVWDRVARHVSQCETDSNWQARFYEMMYCGRFVPNSPTLRNAGDKGSGCLSACFVISPKDSMFDIMETCKEAVLIEKWGGGIGFDLSSIRPFGSSIQTTHKYALGPIGVMRMLSHNADIITQGSFRRGAHLAGLDVSHPDIFKFIHCLSGSSLVETIEGKVPIKDLVGKNPLVYCTDGDRVYLRRANKVWKVGQKQVIRIHFDKGQPLTCTADHLIMLRDGSWLEAGKLKIDARVKAFYKFVFDSRSKKAKKQNKTFKFRCKVGLTGPKIYEEMLSRVHAEYKYQRPLTVLDQVDHKDNDSLNDSFDNIQILTRLEHTQKSIKSDGFTTKGYNFTKEQTEKRLISRQGYAHSEVTKQKMSTTHKENYTSGKVKRSPLAGNKKGSNNLGKRKFSNEQVVLMKIRYAEVKNYTLVAKEFNCDPTTVTNIVQGKIYRDVADLQTFEVEQGYLPNHKVIKIELLGIEDVYDMEVPDFHSFIANDIVVHNCKDNNDTLSNFNISVGMTDAFIHAVQNDQDWNLIAPHNNEIVKTIKAKELWNELCQSAWKSGDPGLLFYDRMWETDPCPHLGKIMASNPCFFEDTLITTTQGLKKAKDIKVGDIVKSYDVKTKEWKNCPVVAFYNQGQKEGFKITTKRGYEVILTEDHTIVTKERGKIKVKNLEIGETFFLQAEECFGTKEPVTELEAEFLGFFLGDGWVSKDNFGIALGTDPDQIIERYTPIKDRWFPTNNTIQNGFGSSKMWMFGGSLVKNWLTELGFTCRDGNQKVIPQDVFTWTKPLIAAFIRGYFTADGSFHGSPGAGYYVQASSKSKELLQNFQVLLLQLGIKSGLSQTIEKNLSPFPPYTTKSGEVKTYVSKNPVTYYLTIQSHARELFFDQVGFWLERKNNLYQMLPDHSKKFRESAKKYEVKVVNIESVSLVNVVDFTVDDTHTCCANGLVTGQCGEQQLRDYESCNLASLNLGLYFNYERGFNWNLFKEDIHNGVRFLDNVVEVNTFPLKKLQERNLQVRRIGLGIMGLADLLTQMDLAYDSPQGRKFTEEIARFFNIEAWQASAELAVERGPFPEYEKSTLRHTHPPVRNCSVTSIQPTGSVSRLVNASFGLEPYYSIAYWSNIMWKSQDVQDSSRFLDVPYGIIQRLNKQIGEDKATKLLEKVADDPEVTKEVKRILPWLRTAHDVAPVDHVKMQALWVPHISNSISKTCNLPNSATVEDISNVYMLAWQMGLKSFTVYRDGCKPNQVLNSIDTPAESKTDVSKIKIENHVRDEVLPGVTRKITTGHGGLYITTTSNGQGPEQPVEVFINLGKSGGCVHAFSEALGRLLSTALQHGVPVEKLSEQLVGISCEHPAWHDGNLIRSVPDAVGQALRKQYVTVEENNANIDINMNEFCPQCNGVIVLNGKCKSCLNCSYSTCS